MEECKIINLRADTLTFAQILGENHAYVRIHYHISYLEPDG